MKIFSTYAGSCIDGDGIRFLVFVAGCNLRCPYCHNIDAVMSKGTEFTTAQLVEKTLRYKPYFGKNGGVTVSGGEPLLQERAVSEYFTELKKLGINTAIETNGTIVPCASIPVTDTYIVDIKDTEIYSQSATLETIKFMHRKGIKVYATHVVRKNTNKDEIEKVRPFVDKLTYLPLSNICKEKYEKLGLEFKPE